MANKSLSMIGICQSELLERGFRVSKTGAHRDNGIVAQGIGIQRQKNNPQMVGIVLDILVWDDFQSPPEHLVCLRGYLFRSGKAGFHAADRYWSVQDLPLAIPLLLTEGIQWLDQHSDLERLRELLNSAIESTRLVEEIEEPETNMYAETELTNELSALSGGSQRPKLLPAAYYQCVSLLEFGLGNRDKACLRANQFLERLGKVKGPGEPARTLRQLQAMRCSSISDSNVN